MTRADDYQDAVRFGSDVDTLKKMILRGAGGRALMFISIVGESGVGKRTLGKVISDDAEIEELFRDRDPIRYNMSPDCTTVVFLEEIRRKICSGGKRCDKGLSITSIGAEIRGLLKNKPYLMVLGGITSKTTLNCLIASLPDDNNGSTVVLTLDTESEEVAWHMNAVGVNHKMHHLDRLDDESTERLFRARAFRKLQCDCDEEMSKKCVHKNKSDDDEEVSKKYEKDVYDITGGYPLAIVVLAGLLRFKERPGQWEAVLQHLRPAPAGMQEAAQDGGKIAAGSGTGTHKDGDGQIATGPAMPSKRQSTRTTIENVFWESFEDLTNDLKSCFLYFAAYSKNTRQDADEVVRMWIGEGFVKPQKGRTMEELGHSFLKELVLRCLVEKLSENASGRITTVRVHTRLHGFLQSEAREAGFVEFRDVYDAFVPPSVRRLSFYSFDGRFIAFANKFRKLRSFMCRVKITDEEESSSRRRSARVVDGKKASTDLRFLRRSKFLRVISIVGLRLGKLPDEICTLLQLRYLRVSCKGLKDLPSNISRLINLQTLDIRGTEVNRIDPCFWNIKALRHVLAESLTLPATIEEELDELQTLHGVKPDGKAVWNPEAECALHKMTKIRSLKLHGFRKDMHGAALKSALPTMRLLAYLKLQGDVIPSCIFTADNLEYLEKIVLEGTVKWKKVPQHVRRLRPNLLHLKLINCNEAPENIPDELADILRYKHNG